MLYQLTRHQRHVVGGGDVTLLVQSVAVFEGSVPHAELCRAVVHLRHEGILAAAQVLGKRDRRVIGARHHRCLDHVVRRHALARLQPNIAAAHRRRVLARGYRVVRFEPAAVHRLKNEQQRHHLGNRRARAFVVRIFLIENFACGSLHQHRRRRRHQLLACRADSHNRNRCQRECQYYRNYFPKHKNTSLHYMSEVPVIYKNR